MSNSLNYNHHPLSNYSCWSWYFPLIFLIQTNICTPTHTLKLILEQIMRWKRHKAIHIPHIYADQNAITIKINPIKIIIELEQTLEISDLCIVNLYRQMRLYLYYVAHTFSIAYKMNGMHYTPYTIFNCLHSTYILLCQYNKSFIIITIKNNYVRA